MPTKVLIYCALMSFLIGCAYLDKVPTIQSLPFVHKIEVQQGNVITQDMVSQLQRGMDKKKVQFIMGNPIIKDTFNSDRWDYLYTFHIGEGQVQKRLVTLFFKENLLDQVEGDVKRMNQKLVPDLHNDTSVHVPPVPVRTFMDNVKRKIPFVKVDEKAEVIETFAENNMEQQQEKETIVIELEQVVVENPYDNIQEAPGAGLVNAVEKKESNSKKGLFSGWFEEPEPKTTAAE